MGVSHTGYIAHENSNGETRGRSRCQNMSKEAEMGAVKRNVPNKA